MQGSSLFTMPHEVPVPQMMDSRYSGDDLGGWLPLEGRSGLADAVLLQRLLLLGVHEHRRPGMQLLHPRTPANERQVQSINLCPTILKAGCLTKCSAALLERHLSCSMQGALQSGSQ